ncbi:MAG: Rne/Rng family ribonuclease [Bacteroides sp.]|nr:Rne/Rng family ribonuclease [Roseburia sp.]MCM1347074.1 Rne/Rng family ribonuclease [Bacteroides sp.]MCM1420543.1 Rne/Rng family ribonuclease [Bacteroides sp.]
MTSELIIDVQPKEVTIALLEDQKLVEFQKDAQDSKYSVGNIYAGKVKKIMPGLNACFVDVGHEREAFLHYQDLGSQFLSLEKYVKQVASDRKKLAAMDKSAHQPEMPKDGSIENVLELGQEVVVQITKEPISTKGPRLTGEISFAGRFLVLIPFNEKVSVSSKIKSKEERARLKQLIQSIKPKHFGVIVRTVAEGKRAAELNNELSVLLENWNDCLVKIQQASSLPVLAHEETGRTVSMLRDLFNPSYENIYVNDADVFNEVKRYVSLIAPECAGIVKLYKGDVPIFDNFSVTKQIKSGFGKTVSYKKGAYLIIEHTEALHVVDVNSGNRYRGVDGQEANAFEVNMGAAEELARQLRLRDMGGIIVVDFIDMDTSEHRQKLYERMNELMRNDRAKHNILPLSKFGLMQITRQRVRPAIDVNVEEVCPTCFGRGTIKSSYLFTDTLESKIDYIVNNLGIKKFVLYVHPYVSAYISQGILSIYRKWQLKYGFGIKVIPSQKLGFLQYEFKDKKGNEIHMAEEIETK